MAGETAGFEISDDIGPITSLASFSMRNGGPSDAKSLLVKATIPASYHWRPITGLAPRQAIGQTAAYIRSAWAGLLLNKPGVIPDTKFKKMAIALGVVRAVTTELYEIETGDLIPGETAGAVLSYTSGNTGTYRTTTEATGDIGALVMKGLELDDSDRAAIAAIHMSAVGILPVQGYSLIMTGHHYLSDVKTQSRRAFDVIERAFWEANNTKEWFDADKELLQDLIWHKACHPVVLSLKMRLAQSEIVPKMLVVAGAGPAASRLPAVESQLRAANSVKTLLVTVRQMFSQYGGHSDFLPLDEAIAAVGLFPLGVTVTEVDLPASVPKSVTNRENALKHLDNVLKGNTDVFAMAYGFYCAMIEQTQMTGGAGTTETLKTSFSLRKLPNQSHASYIAGYELYADYRAYRSAQRAAGKYLTMDLIVNPVTTLGTLAEAAVGPAVDA